MTPMRTWLLRFGRRRRLIAAGLAGLSLFCAYRVLQPPGTPVLVAARDLRPGPLRAGDLRTVSVASVPDGAIRAGDVGRTLAQPMRRGEPLTDVRLLSHGLVAALPPGTVAVPVRIADADAVRLLSPGDTISVLAGGVQDPGVQSVQVPGAQSVQDLSAQEVAVRVPVLAIPESSSDHGALVVLATTTEQARRLAAAQSRERLFLTIAPGQ